jgi:hypothetical protein
MEKELRNVLGRTSAVQLRLSVDRRCPRYEGKASKHKGKGKYKEKWGAVEAGRSMIHSRVSCSGGCKAVSESRELMDGGGEM